MSNTGFETAAFNYYLETLADVRRQRLKERGSDKPITLAWQMTSGFKARVDAREELIKRHGIDATFHLTHAEVNEILDDELATAFKLQYR